MPKSKRAKIVHLGGAKSAKCREWKEGLVERCRKLVDSFDHVYVFQNQQIRSAQALKIRETLKPDTRICLGPVKVMKVALGRSVEEEYQEGLHKLGERMKGTVGLMFSNLEYEELNQILNNKLQFKNFARVNSKAKWDFNIPKGPVFDPEGNPLSHTQEPLLRANGVPTKLNKGVVECLTDYTVCEKSKKLNHKQVAVLRIFNQLMNQSGCQLIAKWDKKTGDYTSYINDEDLEEDEVGDDMNDLIDDENGEYQIDAMEAMEEAMALPQGMMLPCGI